MTLINNTYFGNYYTNLLKHFYTNYLQIEIYHEVDVFHWELFPIKLLLHLDQHMQGH